MDAPYSQAQRGITACICRLQVAISVACQRKHRAVVAARSRQVQRSASVMCIPGTSAAARRQQRGHELRGTRCGRDMQRAERGVRPGGVHHDLQQPGRQRAAVQRYQRRRLGDAHLSVRHRRAGLCCCGCSRLRASSRLRRAVGGAQGTQRITSRHQQHTQAAPQRCTLGCHCIAMHVRDVSSGAGGPNCRPPTRAAAPQPRHGRVRRHAGPCR